MHRSGRPGKLPPRSGEPQRPGLQGPAPGATLIQLASASQPGRLAFLINTVFICLVLENLFYLFIYFGAGMRGVFSAVAGGRGGGRETG